MRTTQQCLLLGMATLQEGSKSVLGLRGFPAGSRIVATRTSPWCRWREGS